MQVITLKHNSKPASNTQTNILKTRRLHTTSAPSVLPCPVGIAGPAPIHVTGAPTIIAPGRRLWSAITGTFGLQKLLLNDGLLGVDLVHDELFTQFTTTADLNLQEKVRQEQARDLSFKRPC